MAPTITAVIIAYWPTRIKNIDTIIFDLLNGTHIPDQIIVFNNNPTWELKPNITIEDSRVTLVDSTTNFTSRSKYAIAMLYPSDYYLLIDDDCSVLPNTVENLMTVANPGACYSAAGFNFSTNYIDEGGILYKAWGDQVSSYDSHGNSIAISPNPQRVEYFQGILQFLSFEAVINVFRAEKLVRIPDMPNFRFVGEDILVALANNAYIVKEASFKPLPVILEEQMQHDYGYFHLRNIFYTRAREALGWPVYEGKRPDQDDTYIKAAKTYLEILKERDKNPPLL